MRTSAGDRKRRRRQAEGLYELEWALCEESVSDFVYGEEHDLFRFPEDTRSAFTKEWVDVKVLQERGYFG